MMDELKKLMDKKKKENGEMSPAKMSAKMTALKELRGIANDAIGKDLGGLKKVTVASDSKEGLSEGLEKAEDIVEGSSEMSEEDEDMEGSESYQAACDIAEKLSPEEKQKLIEKLSAEESSEEDPSILA